LKNTYNKKSRLLPILSTLLLLIISFYSIFEFTEYAQHKKTKTEREKVLEKALYSRIYYTKGVAAYISLNPEINHLNFQELAEELIQNDSLINTMSIAKDGVISSIYPYKGHEEAVGLDLLSHPARREIVEKTIETHNTFVEMETFGELQI
jgi:sensor domain CHASE-containing protein